MQPARLAELALKYRLPTMFGPLSIVGWICDPDHSLPPGMYVDVPHLDCLLIAAPITLEGLDHLILKPRYGLARAEHAARLVRRPTLTAPARDDMGEARVGTKERLSDRTKELMKEVRRRAETP
jgi:hypothetical protein